MDNAKKTRFFALFVGLIMLLSTAGFAIYSPVAYVSQGAQTRQGQQGQQGITLIVERELSSQEILAILNAGRTLIQYKFPQDCDECFDEKLQLEVFVQKYSQFIILEETTGTRRLQVTGGNGEIKELSDIEINEDNLLDIFCEISLVKPRDCLFRDIGTPQPAELPVTGNDG